VAAAHDLTIGEDEIFADLEPEPSARLAVLDGLSRVVRIGGFSKKPVGLTPPYRSDAFWLRLGQSAGTQAMRTWLSLRLLSMASAAVPPASPPGFDR